MTFSDHFPRLLLILLLSLLTACSSLPGKKTAFGDGFEIGGGSIDDEDDASDEDADEDTDEEAERDEDDASDADRRAGTPARRIDRNAPLPRVLAPGAEADAKKAAPQYQQALQLMKAGRNEQALATFRSLTSQYPSLTGPALNQALILQKMGRLPEAAKVLKKAAYGPTRDPRVMNQLGVVSRQSGQFQEARQAYQAALRLAPNYDKAHYNLAILADLYLGDLPLAIAEFEKYQSLQEKRDRRVDGWLKDLRRRVAKQ